MTFRWHLHGNERFNIAISRFLYPVIPTEVHFIKLINSKKCKANQERWRCCHGCSRRSVARSSRVKVHLLFFYHRTTINKVDNDMSFIDYFRKKKEVPSRQPSPAPSEGIDKDGFVLLSPSPEEIAGNLACWKWCKTVYIGVTFF